MDREKISTLFIRSYLGLMITGIISMRIYVNSFPKIKTQKELERVLKEERLELKLTTQNIIIRFGDSPWDAQVQRIAENTYEIILDESRDRPTIRHELYHIYKGHSDKDIQAISKWEDFTKEFKANAYGMFKIKL